ncbi:hypothetical protein [Clostridium sp. FP1]|uniref:hypothetical protein n=1 Tax=Clostridium sp. FP1 TaxID=2724076 RepID=UPI0013E94D5E|nr:hypothetical protein [Clostridium sp. FP1]MBZ9635075.1 hypothetical protein [Clostridium sp. FP1]
MLNVKDKETFQISMEDIIGELENSEYKERYEIYDTYLGQDADRWRRGYKSKFQQSLVDDNLMYFAYIKFYVGGEKKYALVAGKSGSYTVNNSSGCDLGFYLYPQKGSAKKWLYDNEKQWCQTEFLVIATNVEEKEKSCKEAEAIEKYLVRTFGLFES